ncbi:hypothetical protein HJC23_002942 [Cyclotella cryptica]|uniref:Uncharacterized protein n=1 Tax=Cyclotella cryptica TaxID=29204 RepID=A0ABD3PRG0_9STRA
MASHVIAAALFVLVFSPLRRGVSAFCTPKSYSPSLTTTVKRIVALKKSDSSTTDSDELIENGIRYLGSGPDAIVRPGVVLVAPKHEYDHFLMKSAVFVYAIGLDDNQDMVIRGIVTDSRRIQVQFQNVVYSIFNLTTYYILCKGVIIDHPTAFTVGEMSPNVMGSISNNLLFRGGNSGGDTAMMLHSAGGPHGPIQSGDMIGNSGIYEGGIVSAMEAVDSGLIDASHCKFFFNYMQFRELELDDMFASLEDGDAWASLEVPSELVLDSDLERGEMWSKLHNAVKRFRISP